MAKRGPKPKRVKTVSGKAVYWQIPAHLDGEAVEAWHHVVGLLTQAGTLKCTDPVLVEAYAINVAMLRMGHTMISKVEEVDLKDPAFGVINSATMRVKAIIHELGLSPASNKFALPVSNDSNEDKWSEVLGVAG